MARRVTPRAYAAAINAVARRYARVEDGTMRTVWRLMRDVRNRVVSEMVTTSPSMMMTRGFQADMLRYLDQFDSEAGAAVYQGLELSLKMGVASFAEPLISLGYMVDMTPDAAMLNALQGYSADLVKSITEDMRKAINSQVRLVALGQLPPFEAMQAITTQFGLLDMHVGREVVKGVGYRAERILRTELNRLYNIAHHSKELQSPIPDLRKRWIATGDSRTRPAHLRAHQRYALEPIPVNQPFIVDGEALMYPMDPSGSPENTINCRCRSVTIVPEVGVLASPLDAMIGELLAV